MTCNKDLKTVALLACSGLILVACGLRGKLETPPPLWGDDNAISMFLKMRLKAGMF